MRELTHILSAIERGDPHAARQLLPLVYEELRKLAAQKLAQEKPGQTLQATALVHEAYLKLVDQSQAGWQDRAHFLAVASMAMRHVLVDRARARDTLKRGGARLHVMFDDEQISADDQAETLLHLDEALDRLTAFEPRLARVVECRFFGGLTEAETAEALGLTVRTIQRDWVKARVLLRRALDV